MTLADALHDFELSRREVVLTILYLGGKERYLTSEVVDLGVTAGFREIRKWNVSDILASSKGKAIRYADGWSIGKRGISDLNVKGILAKSSTAHVQVAADLRKILLGVKNDQIRSFVEEAVGCYESGYFRAAVVLSWVGAVSVLHEEVIKNYLVKFNAEARRLNAKWKDASTGDHLGLLDEGEFLDLIASPNVGLLGKNVKEELKNSGLKLRNGCGHPNSMIIGRNKASAHIEFLIENVFSKFSK
jgi:hypothetical protein